MEEQFNPAEWESVTEGQATIYRRKEPGESEDHNAFYNPIQEFNRDLSVAVLNVFSAQRAAEIAEGRLHPWRGRKRPADALPVREDTKMTVMEALAASGLRSVRYCKEVQGIKRIVVNDCDPAATAAIERNMKLNGIDPGMYTVSLADAVAALHREEIYDVVDLDPYGSPAPFVDGSVLASSEGALLCVTFTDMAVLCGAHGDVCASKYGSVAIRKKYCHEEALRIGIAFLQRAATRHRRHIVPLLSVSVDYYMRLFVRIHSSPGAANASTEKMANVFQCVNCDRFGLQPLVARLKPLTPARVCIPPACDYCGSQFMIGGPIWAGPMYDPDFTKNVLDWVKAQPETVFPNTRKRIIGVLSAILDEGTDYPLFYDLESMCHTLRLSVPARYIVENAFRDAGYTIAPSHTEPQAMKTNAPHEFIWSVLQQWAKDSPPLGKLKEGSVQQRILSKEQACQVDLKKAAESPHTTRSVAMFLPNPTDNWGPQSRAGRKRTPEQKAMETKAKKRARKEAAEKGEE